MGLWLTGSIKSTIVDVAARCGAPSWGGRLLRAVRAGIWAGMALNARKAREDVRQWTTQGFSMTRSDAFMPTAATGCSSTYFATRTIIPMRAALLATMARDLSPT